MFFDLSGLSSFSMMFRPLHQLVVCLFLGWSLGNSLAASFSAVAAVGAALASFFRDETTAERGKTVVKEAKSALDDLRSTQLMAMGG